MKRRTLLKQAVLAPLYLASSRLLAETAGTGWRSYALDYEIDLTALKGPGQLWLPLPQDAGDYQRARQVLAGLQSISDDPQIVRARQLLAALGAYESSAHWRSLGRNSAVPVAEWERRDAHA